MGYRSDVGLCLAPQGAVALTAALTEAEKSNAQFKEIMDLLNAAEVRIDANSGTVAYLWEATKWYGDFPEVAFIEHLLSSLEASDYLFIRVGESDDDTECCGKFWENPLGMTLVRGIGFD